MRDLAREMLDDLPHAISAALLVGLWLCAWWWFLS